MFLQGVILSIFIGYILKGRLKNINVRKIRAIYLVLIAFFMKFILLKLTSMDILSRGAVLYVLYLTQYSLLALFVIINRKDKYILIMGVGFLLNALVIFTNGGSMPVSLEAAKNIGFSGDSVGNGLYRIMNEKTILGFLGDKYSFYPLGFINKFLPFNIIKPYVASLGDFVLVIGLGLYIIMGMTSKKGNNKTE
ncbi:MAG: DUF5317 family protein [Clostridiaceae bacterium]